MKAVLLCAGQGTRLRPLTYCRPKHLLPVAGRPVLDHGLSSLSDAGVDEAIFVVSSGDTALHEFVGDGSRWGMAASCCVQTDPLGLAHALACARTKIGENEHFLMYLGDDLLGDGVTDFAESFRVSDAVASLVVKPVSDPRAFGVVVMEDGVVTRLVEKPADPPSDLAIVGVYGFGPEIWAAIDAIEPSARGELEITDAIDHLVATGQRVECHVTHGFWADAGSPRALLAANRFFLEKTERRIDGKVDGDSTVEGNVALAPGASVAGSEVIGPCIIGENCTVEDSSIGPNVSVGHGCVLRGVEVRDSIIDEGTSIEDVEPILRKCVVGRSVRILGLASVDAASMSLLLADESVVGPTER